MTDQTSRRDLIEIISTVLLAFAAVATAWSSYQATRWHGEQAIASGRTNAIRIEASRAETLAAAETEIDVATFIQWIDARAAEDTELADFYRQRFRDEFQPAFDAWLDTDPFANGSAPPTPLPVVLVCTIPGWLRCSAPGGLGQGLAAGQSRSDAWRP